MTSISAAIITLNEERKIGECLQSLSGVADEIVVVDSFSTDMTESICLKYNNVRFVKEKFRGYIEQKNYAFSLCEGDYILGIDGDEVLSDELRRSLIKIKGNLSANGYSFPRLNNYCGQWIYHCGWYPDKKLRLVKKGFAQWKGDNPHDILEPRTHGEIIELKEHLLHYSYNSISDHILQTNKFTEIAAQAYFKEGKKSSIFKIITRPPLKFLKDYFLKLGVLDGWRGLIICCINALYAFLKYAKLYELEKKNFK